MTRYAPSGVQRGNHGLKMSKEYTNGNINLRWENFPGGTGEMCKALRTGAVDIAIVLTEGIIKDISEGNPSKIVQVFVDSPLIWGVHVHKNSMFNEIKYALTSRFNEN